MSTAIKKPIIKTVSGKNFGPTVTIMAGVHGNEKQGVYALKIAQKKFKIIAGKVHWIIANPGALQKNKRFLEMNLNRAFKPENNLNKEQAASYERSLAKEIIPFLDDSSALLDLHSVSNLPATPFIICEPEYFDVARKFPLKIISFGWGNVHPGSTDEYMNERGKAGICVECGHHKEAAAQKRALLSIEIFLENFGLIKPLKRRKTVKQTAISPEYIYKCKKNFKVKYLFPDFTFIKKGTFIGTDGQERIFSTFDGYIIFAGDCEKPDMEAFVLGKKKRLGF